ISSSPSTVTPTGQVHRPGSSSVLCQDSMERSCPTILEPSTQPITGASTIISNALGPTATSSLPIASDDHSQLHDDTTVHAQDATASKGVPPPQSLTGSLYVQLPLGAPPSPIEQSSDHLSNDIFTIAIPKAAFQTLRLKLGVLPPPPLSLQGSDKTKFNDNANLIIIPSPMIMSYSSIMLILWHFSSLIRMIYLVDDHDY
ncbi:unnamed protein product, partial [Ilex paraguariensis]